MRLAIDPGDIHVGWALGGQDDQYPVIGEWTPRQAVEHVRELCAKRHVDEVIIEEFVLYPGKAKDQAGSPMKTSQLIGAIKNICDEYGVEWVEQGAHIKKPTRAQLKGRGIRRAKGSIHARDAEEHWWYRTLRARAKGKETDWGTA